jgi:hypothetical protein
MNPFESPALREIERRLRAQSELIRGAIPPLSPHFEAMLADERRWRALAAEATRNLKD